MCTFKHHQHDCWCRHALSIYKWQLMACCAVVVQILMNVPFTAIHFSAYEAGKRALGEAGQVEGLWSELLAGGLAGESIISTYVLALLPCCRTNRTTPQGAIVVNAMSRNQHVSVTVYRFCLTLHAPSRRSCSSGNDTFGCCENTAATCGRLCQQPATLNICGTVLRVRDSFLVL